MMIRPFALDDLDRILLIEHRSFPKSPYDGATFVNLYYTYPGTFLVDAEPDPGRKEDRILGYIVFSTDGHIISIAVHPESRRRGIGRRLVERALKASHTSKVWAEVRKSNQGAQAFYHELGFQVIGMVPDYYGNEEALIVQWTPGPGH
jgi:ribosomal-protein-alanine N-acetyltransferase